MIRWTEPKCSDINDAQVIEYMIRYGPVHSETQRMTKSTTETTIIITDDDLEGFSEYSIEVAAVNSQGVGQYSQAETVTIIDGESSFVQIFNL